MSMFKKAHGAIEPRGAFLTKNQIEQVARTVYLRYQHDYGLTPNWGDHPTATENCRVNVKRTLDALEISGYIVKEASKEPPVSINLYGEDNETSTQTDKS